MYTSPRRLASHSVTSRRPHMCTYTHIYIYIYMYTYVYIYMYLLVYILHTHIVISPWRLGGESQCTYIYVFIYT